MEIPKAAHDCVHRCLGKKAGRYEQKSHEYYYGVNGLGIKLGKHTYIYFIRLFFSFLFLRIRITGFTRNGKQVVTIRTKRLPQLPPACSNLTAYAGASEKMAGKPAWHEV